MFSSPIFHGCVNERLADRTPSPTFSTADSDITELADEQQDQMDDFDDEPFVDDTGSDVGNEEGSDLFSDGHDPFYDRSPWFILVGRLVRLCEERVRKDKLRTEPQIVNMGIPVGLSFHVNISDFTGRIYSPLLEALFSKGTI